MIDGKATLVSELMCDGLGACIGHCPVDAITIEEREAEAYSEAATMAEIVKNGKNVVIAHLKHLKDHGETDYLRQGVLYLKENTEFLPFRFEEVVNEVHNYNPGSCGCSGQEAPKPFPKQNFGHSHFGGSCPGSSTMTFKPVINHVSEIREESVSELSHWPIQMHLINPLASHFKSSDLLLAADCAAFSMGNFHSGFLKGKTLAIACPKLDSDKDVYVEKLIRLIDDARINTITVVRMEVPCCGGLTQLVQMALQAAKRKVPVKVVVLNVQGQVISDAWI